MDKNSTITFVWKMLGYAYGAVLILIGLDKVLGTHFIVEWSRYISPFAQSTIPLDPATFLIVLGIAEIAVGALFFTLWVRAAAYISIIVLALIIVDLLDLRMYDIAARDALIALGAYAVVLLAGIQGYTLRGREAGSAA